MQGGLFGKFRMGLFTTAACATAVRKLALALHLHEPGARNCLEKLPRGIIDPPQPEPLGTRRLCDPHPVHDRRLFSTPWDIGLAQTSQMARVMVGYDLLL